MPAEHVVVVRVYDRFDNMSSAKTVIRRKVDTLATDASAVRRSEALRSGFTQHRSRALLDWTAVALLHGVLPQLI